MTAGRSVMRPRRAVWTLLFTMVPLTGHAVIERMYSLKEVLDESTNVLVGKIDKVDQRNLIAIARVEWDAASVALLEKLDVDLRSASGADRFEYRAADGNLSVALDFAETP